MWAACSRVSARTASLRVHALAFAAFSTTIYPHTSARPVYLNTLPQPAMLRRIKCWNALQIHAPPLLPRIPRSFIDSKEWDEQLYTLHADEKRIAGLDKVDSVRIMAPTPLKIHPEFRWELRFDPESMVRFAGNP